ncbi:MAG: helix-turn-helix domain-containing protein [Propionicimonas sp.]|nr:helix-turn-helix domain-containing protein [Propionicimonas sp.]
MDEGHSGSYHEALASPVRQRVLELLAQTGTSLTTADLATSLGLHVTTVRFHLDHLERARLVERESRPTSRRGRPSIHYRATPHGPSEAPEQLISVLAEALGTHGSEVALEAGRRWAARLDPPPGEPTTVLTETFARLGFSPQPAGELIRLHSCPFRSAAREHPEVVCQAHLGLAQHLAGQADRSGRLTVALQPFAGPGLCLLTVARDESPTAR